MAPTISVVIAAGAGGEFLFRCLNSLREQAAAQGAEVIVADRCGGETAARLAGDYPCATVVASDPGPGHFNRRPATRRNLRESGGNAAACLC